MINQDRLRTIQQASDELKIPKPTLRFWERAFGGVFVPLRTEGGQRRYTAENIKTISEIKQLRDEGISLCEIGDYLNNAGERPSNGSTANDIDVLASRIAEAVKSEVYRFLKNGGR